MRSTMILALAAVCAISPALSPAWADPIEGRRAPSEIVAAANAEDWLRLDPANIAVFELERGAVVVQLFDRYAPKNAAQFRLLARAGFYDGLSFYRVIDGFVAQGGDPFGERALPEGASKTLPGEFAAAADESDLEPLVRLGDDYADYAGIADGVAYGVDEQSRRVWPLHCAGVLAFGREEGRDTASSEFYFTLQPQRYLDRNLSVFGRVLSGMAHLQALTRTAPPEKKSDPLGERIARVWIADAPPEGATPPKWEVFRTDTALFTEYVEARRNRPEGFFHFRPDHVNACALAIPAREAPEQGASDG
ncbi:MAG: peptidylprolyl isomerase [Pseudomonadota bacterium]